MTRDLVRSLAQDREVALALGLARALGLTRSLDLARTLAHDRDLARSMALVRALALARDRVRNLAGLFDIERSRDLARSRDHKLDLKLDLARALDLDLDLVRARTLVRARNRDYVLRLVDNLKTSWTEVASFLYWYIRLVALIMAAELLLPLLPDQPRSWLVQFKDGSRNLSAARAEIQRLIDSYLDLYVDFVILDARIQGNLPAFEGIRIVREQRQAKG